MDAPCPACGKTFPGNFWGHVEWELAWQHNRIADLEAEVERLRIREEGYCDVCGEPHPNLAARKEASP